MLTSKSARTSSTSRLNVAICGASPLFCILASIGFAPSRDSGSTRTSYGTNILD